MPLRWGWRPSFASRRGIEAGVTTRSGGISPEPYRSLNVGLAVGDAAANVWTNRQRVRAALGGPTVILARQVHGTAVHDVEQLRGTEVAAGFVQLGAGDGLVTRRRELALWVTVADCVPVFIWSPAAQVAALLHAGWRGTVGGVVARGVELLAGRFGLAPAELYLAQGPSIGPCCYEVGADVARSARGNRLGEALAVRPGGPLVFDLWRANRLVALRAGLREDRLDPRPPCTCCQRRYFSHRRDGPRTGRQAAVMVLRESAAGGDDPP